MSISTDVSDIQAGNRTFISTKEENWPIGETRHYFYVGHEKVEKISQRTGREYTNYYIYLIEILPNGKYKAGWETLDVFASQSQSLKNSGVKAYQEVIIDHLKNEKGQDSWEFSAGKQILSENDRPPVEQYPDPTPPKDLPIQNQTATPDNEINMNDIPF